MTAVAAVTVALTMATPAIGIAEESDPPAAAVKTLVWQDDFKDASSRANWQVITGRVSPGKSQAEFLDSNVDVRGDALVLRSQRHCVKKESTPLTEKNARAGACAHGKITRYSSARVHRAAGLPNPSGNFRVVFRASLPEPVAGTRSALWMKNSAPYCDAEGVPAGDIPTNLGELDALEWYGKNPRTTTASTHLACDPQSLKTRHAYNKRDGLQPGGMHTWAVERRGNRVWYFVDGARVGTVDVCGKGKLNGVSKAKCDAIFALPWTLIMQGEVFGHKGGFTPPANSARFPAQHLKVDWVKVFTVSKGAEGEAPQPPKEPGQPPSSGSPSSTAAEPGATDTTPTTTPVGGPALPDTGSAPWIPALIGITLFATGVLLLVAVRRRRSATDTS